MPPVTQNGEALSICHAGDFSIPVDLPAPALLSMQPDSRWFAIQTKSRHEKKVQMELEQKGVRVFLPLIPSVHYWSDRRRIVQLPLFGNYLFVFVSSYRNKRSKILETRGVVGFVGSGGLGKAIPDEQIDAVRTLLRQKHALMPYPFVNVG